MALAAINVKKPREAQIWNCYTGNPVLRILPDSNIFQSLQLTKIPYIKNRSAHGGFTRKCKQPAKKLAKTC